MRALSIASITVTTAVKLVGKAGLAMTVHSAVSVVSSQLKIITISMTTSVSLRRAVVKVIAIHCYGFITKVVLKGFLPGIRVVKAALQKIRATEPTLERSRTTGPSLYKTRADEPKLDQ